MKWEKASFCIVNAWMGSMLRQSKVTIIQYLWWEKSHSDRKIIFLTKCKFCFIFCLLSLKKLRFRNLIKSWRQLRNSSGASHLHSLFSRSRLVMWSLWHQKSFLNRPKVNFHKKQLIVSSPTAFVIALDPQSLISLRSLRKDLYIRKETNLGEKDIRVQIFLSATFDFCARLSRLREASGFRMIISAKQH